MTDGNHCGLLRSVFAGCLGALAAFSLAVSRLWQGLRLYCSSVCLPVAFNGDSRGRHRPGRMIGARNEDWIRMPSVVKLVWTDSKKTLRGYIYAPMFLVSRLVVVICSSFEYQIVSPRWPLLRHMRQAVQILHLVPFTIPSLSMESKQTP
jgi:hypothetical protein